MAAAARGHVASINLFVNAATNQIYPLEVFEPGQFVAYLGQEVSTDGPGLGVYFPSNGVLPQTELWVDIAQDLLYWDGLGLATASAAVRMMAPEFDTQGVINDSPLRSYLVSTASGPMTGMKWGLYNGAMFWDAHGLYFLEPFTADAGIYGVVVRVRSNQHADSNPFVIPLVYDPEQTWDLAGEAEGIQRLRQATAARHRADLDDDGRAALSDIDLLVADIAAGQHTPAFDLTGDGLVNDKDLNDWRLHAGTGNLPQPAAYLPGDANLDGVVDVSDFNLWNAHKFRLSARWSQGDFNADGTVDVSDFNIWNQHKFNAAWLPSSPVPEPDGLLLAGWVLGVAARRMKRRRGQCPVAIASATTGLRPPDEYFLGRPRPRRRILGFHFS